MTAQTIKIGEAEIKLEKTDADSIRMRTENQGRISIMVMTKAQASTLGDILKLLGQ